MYELYCDYVLKNPFHEMDQVGPPRSARFAVPLLAACQCRNRRGLPGAPPTLRALCTRAHPLAAPSALPGQVIKSEQFDSQLVAALGAVNRRWGVGVAQS